MRLLVAIIPALVAGCSNPARDAEERYEIVKRTGTNGEICAASREVLEAYLQAGDEKNYQWWHTLSGVDCQLAELAGANAYRASRTDRVEATRGVQSASEEIQAAADEAVGSVGE
jgi:hypothetical protein